jgi:hypothetical protein
MTNDTLATLRETDLARLEISEKTKPPISRIGKHTMLSIIHIGLNIKQTIDEYKYIA